MVHLTFSISKHSMWLQWLNCNHINLQEHFCAPNALNTFKIILKFADKCFKISSTFLKQRQSKCLQQCLRCANQTPGAKISTKSFWKQIRPWSNVFIAYCDWQIGIRAEPQIQVIWHCKPVLWLFKINILLLTPKELCLSATKLLNKYYRDLKMELVDVLVHFKAFSQNENNTTASALIEIIKWLVLGNH